jgi:AraC-like DNA-binding protein
MALYLFHTQGYDNEAVARYLGFHDATNFRRSFKRWTGVTPSFLKQALDPLDWMFTTNNTNNWNIS